MACLIHNLNQWCFISVRYPGNRPFYLGFNKWNNWDRVTRICISKARHHHWLRQLLVPCSMPNRYLNQSGLAINWTHAESKYKLSWTCRWLVCWKQRWQAWWCAACLFESRAPCALKPSLPSKPYVPYKRTRERTGPWVSWRAAIPRLYGLASGIAAVASLPVVLCLFPLVGP